MSGEAASPTRRVSAESHERRRRESYGVSIFSNTPLAPV